MNIIDEREELESENQKKHSYEEIIEYAKYLGFDIPTDNDLLWIAEEGLNAPVSEPWIAQKDHEEYIYYLNTETKEKTYEHPMD